MDDYPLIPELAIVLMRMDDAHRKARNDHILERLDEGRRPIRGRVHMLRDTAGSLLIRAGERLQPAPRPARRDLANGDASAAA